jgi:hypothetical protein
MVAAVLLAFSLPASATLGGDATTTLADQARMKAQLRVAAGANFTVHEMTLPSGTVVREYVSPQGQVFAVTWKGPFKPDLRQLLGSYFDRYAQSPARVRGGHAGAGLSQPDLVVQSSGHPRAFTGRAYLPAMLPANVAESDLQ